MTEDKQSHIVSGEEHARALQGIMAACLSLKLSAYDNLRLVYSMLVRSGLASQAFEIVLSAVPDVSVASRRRYALLSGERWIDCGRINDYGASVRLMHPEEAARIEGMSEQTLAVLNEQQLSLLCMQNSHFDHC